MSGKVVGWAFEQGRERGLSPTQRYTLVAYADNASEAGKCWPDKPEIIEKTGLSQASVYRAIRVLEGGGLLRFAEDEKGRECIYLSVPWSSHSEKADSHCENGSSQGEKRTNKGTVKNRQTRAGKKVNRKTVTVAEYELAEQIVPAFNEVAGTSYTVDAHLAPIVGRIREHPDLSADDHRGIIAVAFADPYWSGPPSPAVIYGNGAIFEKSLEGWRKHGERRARKLDVEEQRARVRREQGLED
jgi:DNA-binding MarR family transcriptional regulator